MVYPSAISYRAFLWSHFRSTTGLILIGLPAMILRIRSLAVPVAFILAVGLFLTVRGAQQAQELEVLQLRPNFYMIAGAGGNIGVQVGVDGVVVVDAGSAS